MSLCDNNRERNLLSYFIKYFKPQELKYNDSECLIGNKDDLQKVKGLNFLRCGIGNFLLGVKWKAVNHDQAAQRSAELGMVGGPRS